MQHEEITTFDQARAVIEQHGLTVEKSPEPKLWIVGGVQQLDKGGVIQEARALVARKAAQATTPSTPAASSPVQLRISQIRRDGGTQSRAGIDEDTVADYARDMLAGAIFPPAKVWFDGTDFWLEDGFQRLAAAERIGRTTFAAEVRQGTRRDAVLASCGANAQHGLRRKTEDKERAVLTLLEDPEWGAWSDREIARRCRVSHDFVAKVAERHGLTGRASSEKTYTTRHGTTATINTANITAANVARAKEEPATDPQPGEIHPLIAAVMEPESVAPPTVPQPGRGMPPTPPVIELPLVLLTTGWQIIPPSNRSAFFVAHNAERGVSTHAFVQLEQAISAAEHAQELIADIEAQGWTIRRDLADPRLLIALHPDHAPLVPVRGLYALHQQILALGEQSATTPAIGTQTTTPDVTDIGDQLAALHHHGWGWHGAEYTSTGWVHLVASRSHPDLARQRLPGAGIANLLHMLSGATPATAQAEQASDRPALIVPQVLVLAGQPDPYQLPEREILTVLYHTAEMIAGQRSDGTTCKRRQERVYCLPDAAATQRVEHALTRYQGTLTAIADHLRALGSYEARLAQAGGIERAPNPLTPTAISAPDPAGYHAPSFDHALKVPRADRAVVKEHTAKMLRIVGSPATISGQQGYFVCPDDASWEHLEQLRAAATEAQADLVALLGQLGTYQAALADGRYGHQVEATTPATRPEPAISWPDVYGQTEAIRRQIAQRSPAGVINATLDLLRLVAGPGQIVLPLYPTDEAEAVIAEIRVLLEQQLDVAAPHVAGFLRAIGRVGDVPPNDED